MITQYLAAGLVSDCKTLAHPDSVDSIPTSGNQEDHVSMSMNAARHARKIVENVGYIVAIELFCGYIALNWRINDIEIMLTGAGYRDEMEKPENKADIDRTRVDMLVMELTRTNQLPVPGEGSREALHTIGNVLYPENNALPELGVQPTTEDRFLQPYLFRIIKLVNQGNLVANVYKKTGIEGLDQPRRV
jgi:hypothetical protein